ncbi:MAG: LysR family transcriptional regulator [Ancalomicrobiaceae bacterium]|nr:LysR family transcriptional regulator [Ancalomicrobiaceae bacterium]
MHSRLLRHFLAVVEKRNITAAAEALRISQPGLTRSIRQLEDHLGITLFDRLPTGVVLTRGGEILARRAKLMELEYKHAVAEISSLEQGIVGVLRIGAGPLWTSAVLPPVLSRFYRQYPGVRVRLTEGTIDSILPALMGGEIDLACVTLSFPSQTEIVKEPLLSIRHTIIVRAGHPLANGQKVTAADLVKYPWVVLANDSIGTSRIGAYFAANGLSPPQIAVETTALGLMRLLEQDDFLALSAVDMLDCTRHFGLVSLPHDGTFWEAEAGIVTLKTDRPKRITESFKAILRASLVP